MGTLPPRAVFVTRETDYELLLARHSTRDQARFFLETRGQSLDDLEQQHHRFEQALAKARTCVAADWRQSLVRRRDLDRFLFTPEDVLVPVGQDGLVANLAKYVAGQPVVGINPAPERYDGVLVRLGIDQLGSALQRVIHGDVTLERRTMVEGKLDNGERLIALNELFVGHRSHQSARYQISEGGVSEEQSSSGLIVSSGTGATGWARSIMLATGRAVELDPQERALGWFVREPFPSVATGTSMRAGKLSKAQLTVTSHMNEGGVIFADGIEQDFIAFDWGRKLQVGVAEKALNLVVA